jgi:SAM-dependent methyltransferase
MMIDFTGERLVPGIQGQVKLERLQRYALCREAVRGKRALDIACGEGNGSAMLSVTAARVVGVDPDPGVVAHAATTYGRLPHLSYAIGSCDRIPLSDRSMDVVIAFDAIQYQDRHDEMLREIRRVLVPGGLLLLSSPNTLTLASANVLQRRERQSESEAEARAHAQADRAAVRSLSFGELETLLKSVFEQVEFWGQRPGVGSFTFPLNHSAARAKLRPLTLEEDVIAECVAPLDNPVWFIAACSDAPFEPHALRLESVAAEPADDRYLRLTRTVQDYERTHQQDDAVITQLTDRLDAARTAQRTATRLHSVAVAELQDLRQEQRELNRALSATRQELDTSVRALDDARRALDEAHRTLEAERQQARDALDAERARAQGEADDLRRQHAAAQAAWQHEYSMLMRQDEAAVNDLRLELASVYDSTSWRLTAPMRAVKRTLDGLRHTVATRTARRRP